MMESNIKTCEPCEPIKTLVGMEQQITDMLFKIHDMLGDALTVVSGEKPIELSRKDVSCLMENVEMNLENIGIIASMSYKLLSNIKP